MQADSVASASASPTVTGLPASRGATADAHAAPSGNVTSTPSCTTVSMV
ncbi:MAG: hypothetical protein R2873_35265 [Caldilineaceae bacterium]